MRRALVRSSLKAPGSRRLSYETVIRSEYAVHRSGRAHYEIEIKRDTDVRRSDYPRVNEKGRSLRPRYPLKFILRIITSINNDEGINFSPRRSPREL